MFRARQILDWLDDDLECWEPRSDTTKKLGKAIYECRTYIMKNRSSIPNYGERYRAGEHISTAFVESTVNQVISKRFVKQQQMRWTKAGAHRLLQVRIHAINNTLRTTFEQWYPGMRQPAPEALSA